MADDTTINKLDGTLKELTGMSQEELIARREQKAQLVAQREELASVKKELEGLGKESVKSSKFLKLQNKLAEDEKQFERKKFTDMLKERARGAKRAIFVHRGQPSEFDLEFDLSQKKDPSSHPCWRCHRIDHHHHGCCCFDHHHRRRRRDGHLSRHRRKLRDRIGARVSPCGSRG